MTFCKLYNDDCIHRMGELAKEDVKVDFVLTDPPFGTTDNKWDKIIPLDNMWEQLQKLSHNLTTFAFFNTEPYGTQLKYSNLDHFKYDWFWIKSKQSGFLHSKNKPLTNVENISVFSNGVVAHKGTSDKRMTYNPQGLVKLEPKVRNSRRPKKNSSFSAQSYKNDTYIPEYSNYPKQTLYFKQVNKCIHPTQKPVDLLKYLIETYTNPNETVLDFTMGSGSTGVACRECNRNFIGIELNEEYYNIAYERINNNKGQTRLI